MKLRTQSRAMAGDSRKSQRGAVLIIVMWIAVGLVSISLYFANSMTFNLRASDNRVAAIEADQTINGATRFISLVLSNLGGTGVIPDPQTYQSEAVQVGGSKFWLIGRGEDTDTANATTMHFGLVDEASKLNLNTATEDMLLALPGMTTEIAASIIDWRDSDSTVSADGGAENQNYQQLDTPYTCKNAPFESIDELRLVYGMNMTYLYGEDANLNGILDVNENDADQLPPTDNKDSRLDAGLLDYVTVYSREPNTTTNGDQRINIAAAGGGGAQLNTLFQQQFSQQRAAEIIAAVGPTPARSLLEYYIRSKMTEAEFEQVEDQLTTTNASYIEGLVNVNSASSEVLACLPGMDTDKAGKMVSYRQSNPYGVASVAWVSQVLDQSTAFAVGPYITGRGYQFTADIAAVGHYGRGYRRIKFVFDTSQGGPKIIYRQDLTHLGWALGKTVRDQLMAANKTQ